VIIRHEELDVPVRVENDYMVEAFAANRTDDAFHVGTLPTEIEAPTELPLFLWLSHLPDTAVDSVAVPQQVTRDLLKRKGLPELLRRPLGRRAVALKCTIRLRS
jgi:hypothetical protein